MSIVVKGLDGSTWHSAWWWTSAQAALCYSDQAPPRKERGHRSPQFSAHVYCGQTAVCIRIPLGTEVGLSLGDIVLDGDLAARPTKGYSSHNFRPMSVVVKRPDGPRCHLLWSIGLGPGDFVLDWDPAPRKKGAEPPPNFCPMSFVVKRLD